MKVREQDREQRRGRRGRFLGKMSLGPSVNVMDQSIRVEFEVIVLKYLFEFF